jgi:hypothetical protein
MYWVSICSAVMWGDSQETYYRSSGCIYDGADGRTVGLAVGGGSQVRQSSYLSLIHVQC